MKRKINERAKDFFINMGRRNKLLRIPAIIGLAVCMILNKFFVYCARGTKRFACTIFILACFMVGNSFAYPVFQENNGFISEKESETVINAAVDSDITLASEQQVEYNDLEILEDEDVLEGYDDAELHGMDQADKYLLDEILEENADALKDTSTQWDNEKTEQNSIAFMQDDWRLLLINKQHPIPDDYTFSLGSIKTIKGNMQCDERIVDDLLTMMQAASDKKVKLAICSPYRDLNRQEVLFNRKVKAYMEKGMSYMEAYKVSSQAVTVPGASEHQIGLAIDIVSDNYLSLDEGFAETNAGKWLAEHSWEYGFILRYPKNKEYITSIEFEPWHFRYVGKEAAKVITQEKITLEEFWDKYL